MLESINEDSKQPAPTDFIEFSESEMISLEKEWGTGSPIKAISSISKKLANVGIAGINFTDAQEKEFDVIYHAAIRGERKYTGIKTIYRIIKQTLKT